MISSRPYGGNCRNPVRKAAKYSIRRGTDGVWQIEIIFIIGETEHIRPSTRLHPALVEMVNDGKDAPGGSFYINEFHHVLVRRDDGNLYCVGIYHDLLEFDVSGVLVSAEPPKSLKPGDPWPGPHVGRPYTLRAGGKDIAYEHTEGEYHRRVDLSSVIGSAAAGKLANRLAKIKGSQGGTIYINERKHFFAPVDGEDCFIYLGSLNEADPWFMEPAI